MSFGNHRVRVCLVVPAELHSINVAVDRLFSYFPPIPTRARVPYKASAVRFSDDVLLLPAHVTIRLVQPFRGFKKRFIIMIDQGKRSLTEFSVYLRDTPAARDELQSLLRLGTTPESIRALLFTNLSNEFEAWKMFPTSSGGFQAILTGSSPHPFKLTLRSFLLSIDQWRAIAYHCPKHISLELHDTYLDASEALHELAEVEFRQVGMGRLIHLHILFNKSIPDITSAWFASALERARSLREVSIEFSDQRGGWHGRTSRLFEVIQRNRGLVELKLILSSRFNLSHGEWVLLWNALGSHPTMWSFRSTAQATTKLHVNWKPSGPMLCYKQLAPTNHCATLN